MVSFLLFECKQPVRIGVLVAKMADAETNKQSKKEGKNDRKAQKAAEAEARRKAEEEKHEAEMKKYQHMFGDLPVLRSRAEDRQGRKFTKISQLNAGMIGQTVLVRARVHNTRATGKMTFIVLRDQHYTCQATIAVSEEIPKIFVQFAAKVNKESIVDVTAEVVTPESENGIVSGASQQDIELKPKELFVFSRAGQVPLQIPDLETPQYLLDEQDATIAVIEAKMVPLQVLIFYFCFDLFSYSSEQPFSKELDMKTTKDH